MMNGASTPRADFRGMQDRFQMPDGGTGGNMYLEAVKSLSEVAGNIWDLLNMANFDDSDMYRAVASLFNRGLRRLAQEVKDHPERAKDITAMINTRDRWYELPAPLREGLSFCVGSNAARGWRAKQVVMAITQTMMTHPDDKTSKGVKHAATIPSEETN